MKRDRRPADRTAEVVVGRIMCDLTWEAVALIHKVVGEFPLPEGVLKADVLRTMEAHYVVRRGEKGISQIEFVEMMKAVFRRGVAMLEDLERRQKAGWVAALHDSEAN